MIVTILDVTLVCEFYSSHFNPRENILFFSQANPCDQAETEFKENKA